MHIDRPAGRERELRDGVRSVLHDPVRLARDAARGGNCVCFASSQPHDTTRGFASECSPTIGASSGMSGNVKPFVIAFAQHSRDEVRVVRGGYAEPSPRNRG